MSYHQHRKKLSKVIVKETCQVVQTLICRSIDLSELQSLVVSIVTCLNDCATLIGQERPFSQGQVDQSLLIGRRGLYCFSKKQPWSAGPSSLKIAWNWFCRRVGASEVRKSTQKHICILFLYIFGVDEVGDIKSKYITERFMNECKESFRNKCCQKMLGQDRNCAICTL